MAALRCYTNSNTQSHGNTYSYRDSHRLGDGNPYGFA